MTPKQLLIMTALGGTITIAACQIDPVVDAASVVNNPDPATKPSTTARPLPDYLKSGGLPGDEYLALKEASFDFTVRGRYMANSKDWSGLGGHYQDNNLPQNTHDGVPAGKGLQLIALPNMRANIDGYRGMHLYLVNRTGKKLMFDACDSNLSITQEAKLDGEEGFKPVEYTPRSWCGNSYHSIALPDDSYWRFNAFRYSGDRPATLRFVLKFEGRNLVSNEFRGSVHQEAFSRKQGHNPTNIMDPYNE